MITEERAMNAYAELVAQRYVPALTFMHWLPEEFSFGPYIAGFDSGYEQRTFSVVEASGPSSYHGIAFEELP